jgi:hypothetical protein
MAEDKQEESLAIRDHSGNEVFKIGPKGEVFWFDSTKGDLVQAKTDLDLGKAFALCIMQIAGMDYVRLIEAYLGESAKAFKTLLIKKIMEKSVKSKTIKKGDLVKIIDEFKI